MKGCFNSERFWSRVKKSKPGCWEWPTTQRMSRMAFRLSRGHIPEGLWVLHTCNNPRCVRPDHLFLGTAYDNMQDMARKKRQVF